MHVSPLEVTHGTAVGRFRGGGGREGPLKGQLALTDLALTEQKP